MKGQKGIRIVAPDQIDESKVISIKPLHLFDVTQTQELAAAWRHPTGRERLPASHPDSPRPNADRTGDPTP
jgi:hypothetical protein